MSKPQSADAGKNSASFLAFFLVWARVMGWQVPLLHVLICNWLETAEGRVRQLLVFRGAAKSTIYAVYKAWILWKDKTHRSLIYAADDKLAGKLTRDTLNVLRRHPWCAGMLPPKPGSLSFWVNGSTDARNPSMEAVGVNSNATGSRADNADFDDIEVPKNIRKAELRENLRTKIDDSTHILVPGGVKTFIGTPHTHESIYVEQANGGATMLKIPLFKHHRRYKDTSRRTRYAFEFPVMEDGLYVIAGIHKFARMLKEGEDYRIEGTDIVFQVAPNVLIDIYSGCAWPERFTRGEIEFKRKETKTLNSWDSQYQLEAKPVEEIRLDPSLIIPYEIEPRIEFANKTASMWLGKVKIAGMTARWDPSSAKVNSDDSTFGIVLQDMIGRRYIQVIESLTGEVAEFGRDGQKIIGGQVFQIADLIEKYHVPSVTVETNGVGAFAPSVLKAALKQRHLRCGVREETAIRNKNQKILESYEDILSSRMLWAHLSVLQGQFWHQLKDFNPLTTNQKDDYIDVAASAITDHPERIQALPATGEAPERPGRNWRPHQSGHEVRLE